MQILDGDYYSDEMTVLILLLDGHNG